MSELKNKVGRPNLYGEKTVTISKKIPETKLKYFNFLIDNELKKFRVKKTSISTAKQ